MAIPRCPQLLPKLLPYRSHIGQVKKNIQFVTHSNQLVYAEVLDATCFSQGSPGCFTAFHDGDNLNTLVRLTQQFPVSYTHLRAHETRHDLVCRLLLEKKKTK